MSADVDIMTMRELHDVVEGFKNRKKSELLQSVQARTSKPTIEDRPLVENYELMTSQHE